MWLALVKLALARLVLVHSLFPINFLILILILPLILILNLILKVKFSFQRRTSRICQLQLVPAEASRRWVDPEPDPRNLEHRTDAQMRHKSGNLESGSLGFGEAL